MKIFHIWEIADYKYLITVGIMAILHIVGIFFVIRHLKNHLREEGIAYIIIMFGAEVIATSFGTYAR